MAACLADFCLRFEVMVLWFVLLGVPLHYSRNIRESVATGNLYHHMPIPLLLLPLISHMYRHFFFHVCFLPLKVKMAMLICALKGPCWGFFPDHLIACFVTMVNHWPFSEGFT